MKRFAISSMLAGGILASVLGLACPSHAITSDLGHELGSSSDANRTPRALGGITCSADGLTCSVASVSPDHREDSPAQLWRAPRTK